MQSMNLLSLYELPEARRDEPKKLAERLVLSSSGGVGGYILIGVEHGTTVAVLGQQVTKAAKNAMNTVRGCMSVQNTLDTFDNAPADYAQQQKMVKSAGPAILFSSTSMGAFVAVTLPDRADPCIVRGEEILAAVENATRL